MLIPDFLLITICYTQLLQLPPSFAYNFWSIWARELGLLKLKIFSCRLWISCNFPSFDEFKRTYWGIYLNLHDYKVLTTTTTQKFPLFDHNFWNIWATELGLHSNSSSYHADYKAYVFLKVFTLWGPLCQQNMQWQTPFNSWPPPFLSSKMKMGVKFFFPNRFFLFLVL